MNKFLRILFASALVGALAFSCAKNVVKEEEAPEEKPVPAQQADKVHTSIEAYIMGDTKTDYLIENGVAKFQWVDDLDHLDVTVQKGEVISSVVFTKKDNGEEGNNYFQDGHVTGEASMADRTGFALSDWAFYPSRVSPEALEGSFVADWSYEGGKYLMDLPSDITIPAGKPLAVVPMAGKKDGINRYAFTQMTGVLAVPVSGLSGDEDFITLQSDDVALSGTFDITFTEQIAYLEQSKVQYKNENGITLHFSGLMGTETFYFPLPVGTIPAGLKLIAGNSADPDTQMEMVTQVNINIARGKIAQTPVLPFQAKDPQWETIGTATYTDDFLWTNNGAFTSAPTVTVTLERSGLNPNRYRINNPYTVASAQVSYTQTDPDSYFVFMVSDEVPLLTPISVPAWPTVAGIP